MEKSFLLSLFLVLLFNLPESNGYCTKISNDWYSCTNIENAETVGKTIQYFLESDVSIKKLSIENCNMSTLSTEIFSHEYFSKITDLNITNSLVEFIELGSLDKLENLVNLNISGNKINDFNGKVLEKLTRLNRLHLKMNQIETIRNVCNARNLKEIFIEDSTLINKNTFKNCDYVTNLSLINTGINSLKTNISLHFPRLISLNLTGNNFVNFDSFDSNATLPIKILDISNNKIKTLDAEIFRKIFVNMTSINLNNNLIKYLVFSGQPFEHQFLKSIYLNNNQLLTLNNVFFKYFSNLQIVDVDNNPLENIASLSFNNLKYLEKLYVKNSLKKIKHLNAGIFDGLQSLTELDLSSASLTFLENFIFQDLTSLIVLNLENNSLTELNNGTFAGLNKLKQLNLDNNKISSIEAGAFFGLNLIEVITPKTFFSKIQHLKREQFGGLAYNYVNELDLSYLDIKEMEIGTFKGLFALKKLNLQGNIIKDLQPNVFEGLDYLENLNVSFNNINVLKNNAFSGLKNLRTLDLSGCQLQLIQPDAFEGLYGLFVINLSDNRLKTVEPWLFRKLHSLNTLYLHDNTILNLPAHGFTGLSSIKNLTLHSKYLHIENLEAGAFLGLHSISSNINDIFLKLKVLKTNMFVGTSNLRVLNLNNYNIETIEPFAFEGLNYIDYLNLENNNVSVLHKNAFTSPVTIELLNLRHNNLMELSSDPFINSNITNLILDENNFNTLNLSIISEIPYLQILNINNASIENLIRSTEEVKHLKELYLRNNIISYLNYSMFIGFDNLLILDLSGNPLTKIEFAAFEQLNNLQELFLSDMKINDFSLSTLSGLKSLTSLSIHNSSIDYLRGYSFINTNIQKLIINSTYVKNLSPIAFDGMKNLTHLTFTHSNFTSIEGIFNHSSLVTLKHLTLSHNRIQKLKCNELNLLNQLKTLDLNNNEIYNIDVCAFTNLTSLITLNLFSNRFNKFIVGTFTDLQELKTLNASYNNIVLSKYDLYPLKKIDYLDFSYNNLDYDALKAFESITPNFSLRIGLAGNKFRCTNLFDTLKSFEDNKKSLLDYGLVFNVTNLKGISCML